MAHPPVRDIVICPCGKEFSAPKSATRKYCSRKCSKNYISYKYNPPINKVIKTRYDFGGDVQVKEYHGVDFYTNGVIVGKRNTHLIPRKGSHGYASLCLYINGESKETRVHRIMAQLFVPNPENKPQVNHIDFDRMNYLPINLEWVTNKENSHHSARHNRFPAPKLKGQFGKLHPNSQPIIAIADNGNETHFENAYMAAKEIKTVSRSAIRQAVKRNGKSAGFRWKFKTV